LRLAMSKFSGARGTHLSAPEHSLGVSVSRAGLTAAGGTPADGARSWSYGHGLQPSHLLRARDPTRSWRVCDYQSVLPLTLLCFQRDRVRAEVRCLGGQDGWRAVEQALRAAGGGPLLCRLAASTESKVATKALRLLAFFCVAREVSAQQATRGVFGVYHTTHIQA
jgi:hypothetical protein